MACLSLNISIVTLNVNLITPIKRQNLAQWTKKHDPTTYSLPETNFKHTDIGRYIVKGQKKIHYANFNQWKAGVGI